VFFLTYESGVFFGNLLIKKQGNQICFCGVAALPNRLSEVVYKRVSLNSGPSGDRGFCEFAGIGNRIFAVAVDDDSRGLVGSEEGSVDDVSEVEFFDLSGLGDVNPDGKLVGIQVGNDLGSRLFREIGDGFSGGKLSGRRSGLAFDEGNDVLGGTSSIVVHWDSAPKKNG
jgi:hypothetical protein